MTRGGCPTGPAGWGDLERCLRVTSWIACPGGTAARSRAEQDEIGCGGGPSTRGPGGRVEAQQHRQSSSDTAASVASVNHGRAYVK